MKGDILIRSPSRGPGHGPLSVFLCHAHADAYRRWDTSAKFQSPDCGSKGYARDGFGETLRLCATHLREAVVGNEREGQKNLEETKGEEQAKPLIIAADQSLPTERNIQFGECVRENRQRQEEFAKAAQLSIAQVPPVPSPPPEVTDRQTERVAEDTADPKTKKSRRKVDIDDASSSSGRQNGRKKVPEIGTETIEASGDIDESVTCEDLKRTLDKEQGESLPCERRSLRPNDEDSRSVAIGCLQRCAKKDRGSGDSDVEPMRDILMATTCISVGGVRNKSSLP